MTPKNYRSYRKPITKPVEDNDLSVYFNTPRQIQSPTNSLKNSIYSDSPTHSALSSRCNSPMRLSINSNNLIQKPPRTTLKTIYNKREKTSNFNTMLTPIHFYLPEGNINLTEDVDQMPNLE